LTAKGRQLKLPNAQNLIVERSKIVDYLLSDVHEDGRHKAAFFRRFGFRPEFWTEMASTLKRHAEVHEVFKEEPSPFGQRFVVDGIMEMPDGRTPLVRTVWFIRINESVPRFVTAFPVKRRSSE
jgi:hypothetical protein